MHDMNNGSFLLAIALFLSTFICSASAFGVYHHLAASTSTRIPPPTSTIDYKDNDGKNEKEPNFHVIAARIGKTLLRPGGSDATRNAHEQANIQPGDTVLELSAGLGRSGIELAKRYGAKVTLTDIDTTRLEKAKEFATKVDVSDLVSVQELDMFKIDAGLGMDSMFDVAQTEASLTHYPRSRKAKFFEGVAKHANKFILHEVCFKTDDVTRQELTKKDLSKVLNIGFIPETEEMWQQLLSDAGFAIDHVNTGNLALLNPVSLAKDEGILGFAKIVFNIATQPYLRSRMVATKGAIEKHADNLGYITIVASRNE